MNQISIKQESLTKIYPTACGLTADNRPNISFIPIPEFNNGMPFSLWYHTTFYKKDDALDQIIQTIIKIKGNFPSLDLLHTFAIICLKPKIPILK